MNDTEINQDGQENVPSVGASFSSLSLREPLLNNLSSLGYDYMTPIQEQSLPIMLCGEDIIAQAKTGSGKTAAFGLCLLNRLNADEFNVQALVLCPTRELAEQVTQAIRRLARLMPNIKILNLSGGMPFKPQLDSLKHGAHIIVGTPGRVQKHLDKESLLLNKLHLLVLDEADRMLDMGFFDAIKAVISFCPIKRQTLLFSATYPSEIKTLAAEFMHHPKRMVIKEESLTLDIEQRFYEVKTQADKYAILISLLKHYQPQSTLIFCNTKEQTTQLCNNLIQNGFSAIPLNGDLEQMDRDTAMIRFANKSCSILVATDVAARGLDIKELPAVINFDLAFDVDIHVHRIGRTGRAGSKGLALSLTTPADAKRLCAIEDVLPQPITWGTIHDLKQITHLPTSPQMITLCLNAGRKDKIRPGDVLGALTKEAGLPGSMIGKIDIMTVNSYVAIDKEQVDKAYKHFKQGKLKGRKVGVKKIM